MNGGRGGIRTHGGIAPSLVFKTSSLNRSDTLPNTFARRYTLGDCISRGTAVQVSKWGNSLAVRLPAAVVEALGLKEGDNIEIQAAGKRTFEIDKSPGARELLAKLRKFRGRLPKDFKFDRLEANERR